MDSALVGVLLGGGLALTGQLATEGFRARRERKAEERREARARTLSIRLVTEELAEASALIEDAARSRRYWRAPRSIPTTTWGEYRTDIATVVESPFYWRIITAAYDAINNLNWTVQERRASDQTVEGRTLGAPVFAVDNTRDAWRAIREAIATLETTLGVTGPASRMLRDDDDAEQHFWPHGDGNDFDVKEARIDEELTAQEEEGKRRAGL